MDSVSAKILPGYRGGYSQIALQFWFGKFEKGKSYWKFNNSLLKDLKYSLVSKIITLPKVSKVFSLFLKTINYEN